MFILNTLDSNNLFVYVYRNKKKRRGHGNNRSKNSGHRNVPSRYTNLRGGGYRNRHAGHLNMPRNTNNHSFGGRSTNDPTVNTQNSTFWLNQPRISQNIPNNHPCREPNSNQQRNPNNNQKQIPPLEKRSNQIHKNPKSM